MCSASKLIIFILLIISTSVFGQPSFRLVPLGVKGGIDESNLSAYMLAPANSNNFVCLDAGTLHFGIEKAVANKVFTIPS
jgi:3',5'-cyclic-nucleotide phosphodiesterase